MRRTTAWGSIRFAKRTVHPATGCAAAISSGGERLRFMWNYDSPWWSALPGARTTAAVRRPLTSTTTRPTPTTPLLLTHPGWRTLTSRYRGHDFIEMIFYSIFCHNYYRYYNSLCDCFEINWIEFSWLLPLSVWDCCIMTSFSGGTFLFLTA